MGPGKGYTDPSTALPPIMKTTKLGGGRERHLGTLVINRQAHLVQLKWTTTNNGEKPIGRTETLS